ncbi:MAG TPA: hypothetical protein VJL88_11750 [Nitrospira sp.]|nr:hypothetical protein [Nitrospira sp.]
MRCSRCQGLMTKDHLFDMEGGFGDMWANSWRCLNCGAVDDTVIQANRRARSANVWAVRSEEVVSQEEDLYLGIEAFVRPAA